MTASRDVLWLAEFATRPGVTDSRAYPGAPGLSPRPRRKSRRRGLDEHEAPPPAGVTARCVGRWRSSRFRRRLAIVLPSWPGQRAHAPACCLFRVCPRSTRQHADLSMPTRDIEAQPTPRPPVNEPLRYPWPRPSDSSPPPTSPSGCCLPGDPARALRAGRVAASASRGCSTTTAGLWGYTGVAPDGAPLTIQSTGMGGPSAAIVISELIDLGARRLLRVGTCGALARGLRWATCCRHRSDRRRMEPAEPSGAGERIPADPGLLDALSARRRRTPGPVVAATCSTTVAAWSTSGLVPAPWRSRWRLRPCSRWAPSETSRPRRCSSCSDLLLPARLRIAPDELRESEIRMGRAALSALGPVPELQP